MALNLRAFHTSSYVKAGGLFRARRCLPPSNTEWGPLTDLPDYSIIGKPTPIYTSEGQRKRALKNFEFTNEIIRLTSEIDYTKRKYIEAQNYTAEKSQKLQKLCLKAKGNSKI